MQEPEIQAAIGGSQELARALGAGGAPSSVVGQELVPGAVDLERRRRRHPRAERGRAANLDRRDLALCPATGELRLTPWSSARVVVIDLETQEVLPTHAVPVS